MISKTARLMLLGGLLSVAFAVPAQAAPTWLAPVDLSAGGGNAFEPQVSIDPQGNATAIWVRYDGTNDVVQAATRAPGGTWQTPITLSAPGLDAEPTAQLLQRGLGADRAIGDRPEVRSSDLGGPVQQRWIHHRTLRAWRPRSDLELAIVEWVAWFNSDLPS